MLRLGSFIHKVGAKLQEIEFLVQFYFFSQKLGGKRPRFPMGALTLIEAATGGVL